MVVSLPCVRRLETAVEQTGVFYDGSESSPMTARSRQAHTVMISWLVMATVDTRSARCASGRGIPCAACGSLALPVAQLC